MFRNNSVDVHSFAMVPRAQVPRSAFNRQTSHKTTINASYLYPVFVDEVVPGDTFNVKMTALIRMSTPVFPVMDNLHFESFFFFVPCRLVWSNWKKFMGEQVNPADSIIYSVPVLSASAAGGFAVNTIFDYFGLPTVGQVGGGNTVTGINALPFRAYNLIYREWFKDENLIATAPALNTGDGPDTYTDYSLLLRGKRKDYFTGALPWPQKGATAVSLPLGTSAPIKGNGISLSLYDGTNVVGAVTDAAGLVRGSIGSTGAAIGAASAGGGGLLANTVVGIPYAANTGMYADLSTATAATINQIRQAFQIQRLLERDARGGTRYTEIVRAHFGVVSPDARLQRPEYLGGGSSVISMSPVPQTSATAVTGSTTAMGSLAAIGTGVARGHGFRQSFTEHGYILGLVNIRADLNYQQGLRKLWSRSTRYDFYFPAFAMLGEQAILNKEIYYQGDGATHDDLVFGYQERWAEMRYFPTLVTGGFRSTTANMIDPWHYAQKFTSLPTLGDTFINDDTYNTLDRIVAAGSTARTRSQQFLMDMFFDVKSVRPLPMFSVPGMIDHF